MDTNVISMEDMNYLAQQSAGNLNMILSGMTAIMTDNDSKVAMLENQTWYQRMSRTILGKNKMTQQEIQQNHDRINMYLSQAMTELFKQNCIDHQAILSLGNRLNEIYADHIQLKQMLGAFVSKLNEKIESIDNFHMLTTEINQQIYSNYIPVVAISKIMSQIDVRTVKDSRKMDILVRAMKDAGIISADEIYLSKLLYDLLDVPESDAGIFSLFYGNLRNEYISEIISDTLLEYYLLPKNVRKMKNRQAFVEKILSDRQIDLNYMISLEELYLLLIQAYADSIVEIEENKIYAKYLKFKEYCEKVNDFLWTLINCVDSWKPRNGEFLSKERIKEYNTFINGVRETMVWDSLLGKHLKDNASNIGFFFQELILMYPSIQISNINGYKVNSNGAINFGMFDEEGEEYDKYYSFWSSVDMSCRLVFDTIENTFSEKSFHLEKMLEYLDCDGSPYDRFEQRQLDCFSDYFTSLIENLDEMIGENYLDFEEVYDLVERYQVDFSEEIEDSYKEKLYNPCIGHPIIEFFSSDEVDEGPYFIKQVDEEATVWLEVFSDFDKYTIRMKVLENYCRAKPTLDLSDINEMEESDALQMLESFYGGEESEAFSIKFGEWEEEKLSIHIKKRHIESHFLHRAKIKFYLEEDPSCAALLSVI